MTGYDGEDKRSEATKFTFGLTVRDVSGFPSSAIVHFIYAYLDDLWSERSIEILVRVPCASVYMDGTFFLRMKVTVLNNFIEILNSFCSKAVPQSHACVE